MEAARIELDREKNELEKYKAELQASTQVLLKQMERMNQPVEGEETEDNDMQTALVAIIEQMNRPKMVIRDELGRVAGVE
jgi:light-regulated signal transduction histidine kinase (bacteriophytochrome)